MWWADARIHGTFSSGITEDRRASSSEEDRCSSALPRVYEITLMYSRDTASAAGVRAPAAATRVVVGREVSIRTRDRFEAIPRFA